MQVIREKHNSFKVYVREVLRDINREESPSCRELLAKDPLEFIAIIKLAIVGGYDMEGIEAIVSERINVQRADVSPEQYARLRRYGEYFYDIAKSI